MRGLPLLLLSALAWPAGPARAQSSSPAPAAPPSTSAPTGLVMEGSLAAGGETGMPTGKAGLLELEVAVGWEHQPTRLRPELAVALGVAPESTFALRPGLRAGLAEVPIWLRAALDFSTARGQGFHARWVLFGAAWELKLNTLLALDLGIDFGIPLASTAGVPLMLRLGGTFRP